MYANVFICFLFILPYISPALSGDKNQAEKKPEYEYYYDYVDGPVETWDWSNSASSQSQNSESQSQNSEITVEEYEDPNCQGSQGEGNEGGKSKVVSGKKSASSSKTVTSKRTKSSSKWAEDPEVIVVEDEEPETSTRTVRKVTKKSRSGQPEETVIEEEEPETSTRTERKITKKSRSGQPEETVIEQEEPEEVVVEEKEEKPKEVVVEKRPKEVVVVENKKKRVPCVLESAFCNKKKRCDPKCVQKLFQRKDTGGLFGWAKNLVAGALEFAGQAACYTTFVGCNCLAKLDFPLLRTCIIDWAGMAQGKMSNCFVDVLCQAAPHCIDSFDSCMKTVCGNERWNNFRKCALSD